MKKNEGGENKAESLKLETLLTTERRKKTLKGNAASSIINPERNSGM